MVYVLKLTVYNNREFKYKFFQSFLRVFKENDGGDVALVGLEFKDNI